MTSRKLPAVIAALTSLALIPGAAIAANHGSGHKGHAKHAKKTKKHAHVRVFGRAAADPSSTTPSSGTPSSTTPAGGNVTIKSFTGGVLTLALADGSTVSGKVTPQTEIDCSNAGVLPAPRRAAIRDGGGEGDSNSQGDDNQGDNNDQGDDDQGDDDGQAAQAPCDQTSLTAGTVVQEAELSVGDGAATWKKVEIVTAQGAPSAS